MNIYELKQERAKVTADIRAMMDKYDGKEMDGVDKETFGNLEAQFDKLSDSINREEKQLERERSLGETVDAEAVKPTANKAMELFNKAITGTREDVKVYNDLTYTLGTNATAGYLSAPMEFREELIKGLDSDCFFRSIARVLPAIGNAQSIGYPQMTARASDAEWVGEVDAAPVEQTMAFGLREMVPHRMAKLIKISRTLMNHSALAPQVLLDEMRYAIAVTQEKAYMTGNGTGKPLGVFVASANGINTDRDVVAGTTSAITSDGLKDVKFSLKEGYVRNATWIFHRDIIKQIAKLKDGEDRYMWEPSIVLGEPDRLLNIPVRQSDFAPNTVAASAYVGILGDFSHYWIVDGDTLEMQILNELYAVNNQNGYLFNYFGDGAPVLAEAFSRVKLAAS